MGCRNYQEKLKLMIFTSSIIHALILWCSWCCHWAFKQSNPEIVEIHHYNEAVFTSGNHLSTVGQHLAILHNRLQSSGTLEGLEGGITDERYSVIYLQNIFPRELCLLYAWRKPFQLFLYFNDFELFKLCQKYFVSSTKTTFQDRLYLQYVELNAFQNEFRELSNKFKENERIIQKLEIIGTSLAEVNAELDNLETVTKALSVDVYKAKKLAKTGETLMLGMNEEIQHLTLIVVRKLTWGSYSVVGQSYSRHNRERSQPRIGQQS